ncbi:MAG: BlaI/MecI/CopY family transcriptional regulator [Sedimentisphaerales bacterium]|nr:BlaI/MecI/CopY family transcriptional regulator [Sedimentisphaerales bacterium]
MIEATKISEAEWRVCRVLWRRSPQTANEIVAALADKTDWNPRTVKTLLNRLVKKDIIGFDTHGREYHYFPRLSETKCVQAQTQSFVKRVFDGAAGAMVAAFLDNQQLSAEEIAELKQMLDEKAGK